MESASLRHQDLGPDQVDPGDHLGDGVLHLDTGVHLDEEPVSPVSASTRNSTVPALT